VTIPHAHRRVFAWLGALLWAITCPRQVAAEPGTEASRTVVLLDVAPSPTTAAARIETLRVHMTDVAARVVVEKPAAALLSTQARIDHAVALGRQRSAVAVIFVEEMRQGDLRVVWVEPKQGRVWMRLLTLGSDGVDAASEKAALIARGGVEELLEAGRMAMDPVAPVPSVPKADVSEKTTPPRMQGPREARLAVGAVYEGTSYAQESPWQNGIGVSIAAALGRGFYVAAKYTFVTPMTIEASGVTAHLVRRPIEMVAGYRSAATFGLRAELGAFGDYVLRSTTQTVTGIRPTEDGGRILMGLSAKIGLGWEVAYRLRLVGMVGAQAVMNHFDYLVDDRSRDVAVHVRTIRPLIEAGIVADVW
jgi:hypothetical protein